MFQIKLVSSEWFIGSPEKNAPPATVARGGGCGILCPLRRGNRRKSKPRVFTHCGAFFCSRGKYRSGWGKSSGLTGSSK